MAATGPIESVVDKQQQVEDAFEKLLRLAGIVEKETDIIQQAGGLRIRVYEAGEYEEKDKAGNKTGRIVPYDKGIEIRSGGLKVIPEASDLALLFYHIEHNLELGTELRKRLDEEKELMKKVAL